MGTYGETVRGATLPTTRFRALQPDENQAFTCDKCVAPSVAAVMVGPPASALSLEFCGHHLAQLAAEFSERGHQVLFHEQAGTAPAPATA